MSVRLRRPNGSVIDFGEVPWGGQVAEAGREAIAESGLMLVEGDSLLLAIGDRICIFGIGSEKLIAAIQERPLAQPKRIF